MKELHIKHMTEEEFKKKFKIDKLENVAYHEISELKELVKKAEGEYYYLVTDLLFEDPSADYDEEDLSEEEIKTIEDLNDEFRDSLIELREFLCHNNGSLDSEKAKELQISMNKNIKEAKEILTKHNISNKEELKKMSNKFFMPDFLNGVFGDEEYNIENEVDCGL